MKKRNSRERKFYRVRWYDAQQGRFISQDSIGMQGGVNLYSYVSNDPINKTDPLGLYEIDVHYYLTYYLARKTSCFTEPQSKAIANADQGTDEVESTLPDFNKRYANKTYHALHEGASPGVGSQHL